MDTSNLILLASSFDGALATPTATIEGSDSNTLPTTESFEQETVLDIKNAFMQSSPEIGAEACINAEAWAPELNTGTWGDEMLWPSPYAGKDDAQTYTWASPPQVVGKTFQDHFIMSTLTSHGDPRRHDRIYQHASTGDPVTMVLKARVCDIERHNGQQVLYVGGGSSSCAEMYEILASIMQEDGKHLLGVTSTRPWTMQTEEDDYLLLITVPPTTQIVDHTSYLINGETQDISKVERGMFIDCSFNLLTKARIEKTMGRPRRTWSVEWILQATQIVTYPVIPQAVGAIKAPRLVIVKEGLQADEREVYDLLGCRGTPAGGELFKTTE
ncbi:hypothetical protein HMN09_00314100 [Mycena chlorophos]|uniref:Uncharacterized protein n=1 Tax=Mycena chlorophos TaxID=658473 RepID=A0A8H6TIZ6_MYCCL|nr:hypothetical protein HMN09_00314100 [Mycena chlorophos]